MKGYVTNIERDTLDNTDYRRVVYTARHSQLVLMNVRAGEEIGNEVHENTDQFIRIEQGTAKIVLNNSDEYEAVDGFAVLVPAGTWHNVINTGTGDLKLYTIYSPSHHQKDTVQATKADEYEEHFDGVTSE